MDASLGPPLFNNELETIISRSKVLVVGAGGIGCELLKNLVLTSFIDIHVIDLDTIDVSNLNRQFLFRRHHVGKSKAEIAREACLQFNSKCSIIAYHANIKEERFGAEFFAQFDIVMNALDNVSARRHVNRLCIALGIPLIESGTQGYIGQTTTIRHKHTECFECQPKNAEKTFAVCTIRNTPDQPVHCVVWAKFIVSMLWGPADKDNIIQEEGSQLAALDLARADGVADRIFRYFFHDDIVKACQVKDRWLSRPPPVPLDMLAVLGQLSNNATVDVEPGMIVTDQTVPSVAQATAGLVNAIGRLYSSRSVDIGQIVFDKDDDLIMALVIHLSNLRMAVFGIAACSPFAIKGIAGNIIHAVASTNAIAAGLIVLEAIKVLTSRFELCRTVWVTRSGPKLLMPQKIDAPNPACYVCSHQQLNLKVNTTTLTVLQLFKTVMIGHLGMNEPNIDVTNRDNSMGVIEDLDDEYLARTLSSNGVRITDGAILHVEDESQNFNVDILIHHCGSDILQDPLTKEDRPFLMDGDLPVPTAADIAESKSEDDGVIGVKRRAESNLSASQSKRRTDDKCIVLEM